LFERTCAFSTGVFNPWRTLELAKNRTGGLSEWRTLGLSNWRTLGLSDLPKIFGIIESSHLPTSLPGNQFPVERACIRLKPTQKLD
ncbi:hypothetical protein, partial [Microcoleus sp. herbarium12]|uniref:hypothetical protein n=1 Tax=Microcoleus sp. herbarium12 TaxID=3055437 RepID=UPI002FD7733D